MEKDGAAVGEVTSGAFGPSLERGIALAYVAAEHQAPGTTLEIVTRRGPVPATVVKPPFYTPRVK